MKSHNVFRRYNRNVILTNKMIALLLFISVSISVGISLAIPQISINIEDYWSEKAYSINGAELMIEANYPSEEFDKKIEELKKITEIRKSETFNTTIRANGKEVYANLIVGEYDVTGNEAILSSNLCKTLKVKKGDNICIEDKEYTIIKIEKLPEGVGKQAKEMGYIKVAQFDTGIRRVDSQLFLVHRKDDLSIEKELKKVGKDYYFSTVEEVEKELLEKNNVNMMALNMVNTISMIMTIVSIFSSIVLVIIKNKRDIAIMKIQSVSNRKIQRVFQSQFRSILYPAVFAGVLLSLVIVKLLLKQNDMDFRMTSAVITKIFLGLIFLTIIYEGYIRIVCKAIYKIKPLHILRNESHKISYKVEMLKGILFTILALCIYAGYVGKNNLFAGSMIIFLLILFLGTVAFLIIKIITMVKIGDIFCRYTLNSIRERMYATLIVVLSISFTILFLLIGFTLSNIVAASYKNSLQTNLNYNYMLTTGNPENVENVLDQTDKTGFYTKLNMRYGTLITHTGISGKIILCGVGKNQYEVKYRIIKGDDIFGGQSDGVIVSEELSEHDNINVGNAISLQIGKTVLSCTVKGIYQSEGMNKNHILISEGEVDIAQQGVMYLAKIETDEVIENLKGVQVVNLYNTSNLLEESLQNVSKIFRSMCLICIVLSFVFNVNLTYIDILEQNKNFVVMRALGIRKKQLYKHLILKMCIIFILTIILSVGNYCIMISYAMKFMFNVKYSMPAHILLMPCLVTAVMLGMIFLIPLYKIRKMEHFDELHESV